MILPDKGSEKWRIAGLTLVSMAVLVYLGYFIPRSLTLQVQFCYLLLFLNYGLLYKYLQNDPKWGIYISIVLRLVLLFSIPGLSDDFNRFIWDGRLLAAGINPFHEVPDYYMNSGIELHGINKELYDQLNYTMYYTMYPPVPQFTGWIATLVGGDSVFLTVLVLRVFVIIADIGNILLIFYLLKDFGMNQSKVLIYAFNPLVILELTGNLHHEVYVILFMLLTVLFYQKRSILLSAGSIALAIASKLLPLIFLPLFISRFRIKKAIWFYIAVFIGMIILFLPFLDSRLFHAMIDSGWLYFQRFEFNASIYYIVREVGYWVKGYNIIQTAGRWLAAITFISILAYTWFEARKRVNILGAFMWVLTIYLMFTTILHPWYVVPLIAFCVFTSYRYVIAWSLMIFLSYAGYTTSGYNEPIGLITLEYLVVYTILILEISRKTNIKHLFIRPS